MPLTTIGDASLAAKAVATFHSILLYSGDTDQPVNWNTKVDLAHKLLRTALHKGPELRDEVFAQLLKQAHRNPRVESKVGCPPPPTQQ